MMVELETMQERLLAKVQTLEEAFQHEKEKNQDVFSLAATD